MANRIRHRGPDAQGIWTGPGIGFAHRRLAIIDLTTGDQPIASEDGAIRVVFNGEIYNYPELRSRLESQGHRFSTHSDTEVLVHLYEEHGEELVHLLRGMFAFAMWDSRRQQLLLARDRVGLKPLYYYQDPQKLIFASELKSILACPGVHRDIDLEALDAYLTWGFIPGEQSIFRSIRKLQPGHTLKIDRDHFSSQPRRYWQLDVAIEEDRTVDDWLGEVSRKFSETVRLHCLSDVPVGAFLSGGIDSSAVVAELAKVRGADLQTFSIGFLEERYSELPHARGIAKRFGTRHFEGIVTPEAAGSLDDLVRHFDEPFADPSAIPTLYLSRLAREHVKVVLSGDGGDEAFGGYSRYLHDLQEHRLRRFIPDVIRRSLLRRVASLWPQADWLPRVLRAKSTLTNLSLDPAAAYANTLTMTPLPLRRLILSRDVQEQLNGFCPTRMVERVFPEGIEPLGAMTQTDIRTILPDDFLTKVDRASMAVGLEVRPPLVDHEFLELSARIPSRFKVRGGQGKWIFKQMLQDQLPNSVLYRRKQGFEIPVDGWLGGPLREQVEATILSPTNPVADYIDQDEAAKLCLAHRRHTARHGQTIWALLVLARWLEEFSKTGSHGRHEDDRVGYRV